VPADQTLRGVWGDGAGIVWAVTTQGNVLRWNGAAWTMHASLAGELYAIWGSSPTDLWIGGQNGLYHGVGTSSSTLAFTATSTPGAPIPITSVWGTGVNDVWAVGGSPPDRGVFPYGPASARVLHHTGATTDGGPSWSLDPSSSQAVGFSAVWGSAATGVWIAGPRAIPDADFADEVLVFHKSAPASAFTEVVLPRDPNETLPYDRLSKLTGGTTSGDSTMWILGRSGSDVPGYWRGTSTNGGATFTFAYEKGGKNDEPHLNAVFGIAANDAWAVGDYGRVRHGTTASPGTWPQAAVTRTKLPLTDPFFAVWAGSSNDVWVVGAGIALHLDPSKKAAGQP
jgi:hypothetical protein